MVLLLRLADGRRGREPLGILHGHRDVVLGRHRDVAEAVVEVGNAEQDRDRVALALHVRHGLAHEAARVPFATVLRLHHHVGDAAHPYPGAGEPHGEVIHLGSADGRTRRDQAQLALLALPHPRPVHLLESNLRFHLAPLLAAPSPLTRLGRRRVHYTCLP